MLFKSSFQVTIISIINILINFLIQLVIAYLYGTESERDLYFVAIAIPSYITALFVGSFGVMFLPRLIKLDAYNEGNSTSFINIFFNNCGFVLLIITLIGIIFSKEIFKLSAPGFDYSKINQGNKILICLFPSIIFQSLANILSSIYHTRNKFILPALAPVITTLTSLTFVILFSRSWGIMSLAMGTLIGSVFACVILLPILKSYKLILDFYNKDFLNLILLSTPIFLSSIISRSIILFERMIASTLNEGSISYLGYANQIMIILSTISISGVATTIFPMLSKSWVKGDLSITRKHLSNGIRLVLFITIPIVFIFLISGEDIISILFERGKFSHSSTIAVNGTFSLLSIAFISYSLGAIVAKVFYLSENILYSSVCEILVTVFHIILALIFVQNFSFHGLAMATSIATFVSVTLSIILARKILKGINGLFIIKGIIKILVASVIAFAIVYFFNLKLIISSNLVIRISYVVFLFLTIFYIISYYLNLEEAKTIKVHLVATLNKMLKK